jgi:hypothetical protein
MRTLVILLIVTLAGCTPIAPTKVVVSPAASASPEVVKSPEIPYGNQFNHEGVDIEVYLVGVLPNETELMVRFNVVNNSGKRVEFRPDRGNVVVGTKQLEPKSDSQIGLIEPGVEATDTIVYSVKGTWDVIDPTVKTIRVTVPKVLVGSDYKDFSVNIPNKPRVSTPIRETKGLQYLPASPSPAPSTAPQVGSFNAEVFDPPSNCRAGANKTSAVKQVLQKGDVLVDRGNPQKDAEGKLWYQEQYLDCWIHQSQIRFK